MHDLLPPARVKGEDWHTNLEDRMRELHIHGLGIAVFEHYRLLWAKGFGLADADTKQPITETTLFQAGSISKAVNAPFRRWWSETAYGSAQPRSDGAWGGGCGVLLAFGLRGTSG